MAVKLSWQQAEMLILIGDWSGTEDGDLCWVPSSRLNNYQSHYSHTLGRKLNIEGPGSAATIHSLVRRGLVKFIDDYENQYWCRITEDGRLLVESWRESGQWPVKVRI